MTIEQVWQYGKDRGAEFFSPYISNVEFYNEGHYMVHSGGIAYLDGEPVEKLKLYCDGINLELGKGEILGEMGVTKEFETDIPLERSGEMLPELCDASVIDEFDRFTFKSRFEKGQMVMLLLESGKETHRYFISTTAVTFLAMCCGTFLDSDERNTRTFINKKGLSGTYDIRVIIDDKKYETGIRITC